MQIDSEYVGNLIDDEYINADLRVILENHMPRLKNIARNNSPITVSPAEAYKYNYDYYNLLRYKGVDFRLHWLTMRINDRINPNGECSDVREIYVAPFNEVDRFLRHLKATKSKGML